MLDLTTKFTDKTFEIKLLDGTILHLKRPSQAVQELAANIDKTDDQEQGLKIIMSLFVSILNRNTEGKKFNEKELKEDYDFSIATYVVKDYFDFWNQEIRDEVNFPNTQQ